MFDLNKLIRNNIKQLKAYSSARNEFSGKARVFLDANESSEQLIDTTQKPDVSNIHYNRYPDPNQVALKTSISELKQIDASKIFLGNGSDECIDILMRCFCEPAQDNIIIIDPTYGMYEVCANINNIKCRKAKLLPDFQIDIAGTENLIDVNTKMIWLCSPNNPTGNTINKIDIIALLKKFNGIVVLDEAYIDFSSQPSFLNVLDEYPNLVILQTFSKAWGLAALRLGMAFASKQIIEVLNKIKPPYNINSITQDYAFKALSKQQVISEGVSLVVERRKQLAAALEQLPFVVKVHSSDANFLLVAVDDAENVYQYLLNKGIVVRNRSNATLCDNCLRITIGSESENSILLQALNNYSTVTI